MERIVYRITLDTHKNGIQRTLQGIETADNMARRVAINLVSGSKTYDMPLSNIVALAYVTYPSSEEPSINSCEIIDNTIVYDIEPITEAGITEIQIKLIESRLDGANKVLISPRFALEVTKSNTADDGEEMKPTFTALEDAVAMAREVYDARLLNIEIGNDCIFKAYYADGSVYETDYLKEAIRGGNATLAESYAKGGTGVREGEDTDNAKYYAKQSKSFAFASDRSATEANRHLEETRMLSIFTSFSVDFETGELLYLSKNYNFHVDTETGGLRFSGYGDAVPEDTLGNVVQAFIRDKSAEIDERLVGLEESSAEIAPNVYLKPGDTLNVSGNVMALSGFFTTDKELRFIIPIAKVIKASKASITKGSIVCRIDGYYSNGAATFSTASIDLLTDSTTSVWIDESCGLCVSATLNEPQSKITGMANCIVQVSSGLEFVFE